MDGVFQFIEFSIDPKKINPLLDKYGVKQEGRNRLIECLPTLTFAERVLWAVTGVKKCSSFRYDLDAAAGRCCEEELLSQLGEMGLSYNQPNECYPEPTLSQNGWAPDANKANSRLPYRMRDYELARWFDYSLCCVEGYREYFDQIYDSILSRFPFKKIKNAKQLDEYVYPCNRKDEERFKEAAAYFEMVWAEHPELKITRRGLIAPIRTKMKEVYDDSFNLLLHFCLPVHDYSCQTFRNKAKEMHSVLKEGIGKNYADLVIERSIFLDDSNLCF